MSMIKLLPAGSIVSATDRLTIHASKDFNPAVKSLVDTHPFNSSVRLFLPSTSLDNSSLALQLPDSIPYYHARLPLSFFISSEFIDSHIKSGSCIASSIDTRIDVDDCVALIEPGHLVLSLTKDTYESAGLTGHKCKTDPTKSRYGASSLIQTKQIVFPMDAQVKELFISRQMMHMNNIYIPDLSTGLVPGFDSSDDDSSRIAIELLEWVGMASIRSQRLSATDSVDSFIAMVGLYEPSVLGDLVMITYKGFIPPLFISRIVDAADQCISKSITEISKSTAWVALHVAGDIHAPVSWNHRNHSILAGGINDYMLIFTHKSIATTSCISYTMESLVAHK
ncbi:hypothetical protein BATDEDRAFT_21684 [Batrachochytrium dendrobatidis JAM81]|uniref:Uncharacterized protein n=2 Tax=Batrachochytrium dendrobatidis TaxID=109871 RepID=F4NUM7_BATDJ|nr:uncharacterized protein BATDEDRAFT_21684 [Batrachochytrium dendrobatidis JAM81]EGF84025.1 hypothetical protein BATDEDRAFT_21684 [Batrachochytrium dendrobatidis JAM81]OAJ36428.1 hypothetical protein BDEG_20603 [Batrachochytrium dendrobatidis JEL423]|eukprot:XP_006675351.1 hypothetical protein BATDEDRAFT_21684 [Batrachochytrium dendrobatidis JAM81]